MHFFCLNVAGKDSLMLRKKGFTFQNIHLGYLTVPYSGSYYQDTGSNSGFTAFRFVNCIYFENFFCENQSRFYSGFSIFTSIVHNYEYYRDTTNFGGLGGVLGIRYYLEFSKHKNNFPPKFNGYIGVNYGRGFVYNPPYFKNYIIGTESIGVNFGLNFHPLKLLNRINKYLTFDLAFSKTLFVSKGNEPQPFGGIGIKYKLKK